MTLHKAIPLASRHAAHAFEYATAAARIGAVGLTAADVRKTAVQLDNNTTWILTNHVGPVWQHVGDNVALVLEPCLVSPRAVTDADNGKTLIAAAFVVGGFQFVLPATATAGTRITLSTLANAGLDARILADATGTIVGGGCLAGAGVSELKATQEGASITLAYLGGPGKQWVVAEGLGSWIVQVAGVPTGDVYAFTPAITGGTLGGIVTLDADGQIADSTVALDTVVIGPAAATDHAIARYELATGKLIQDSLATVDDAGAIDIPAGQKYKINSVDLAASDVGAEVPLTFGDSLSRAVNTVALDNDSAAPGALLQYGTDSAGSKGWQTPFADATIPVPTGFAWASPGFDVFRTIAGYRTSIPWAAFRPTTATKVRYVDIATGSNSDPGDTWGNAWKGIGYALTRAAADPDITLIYVKAGRYSFGDGWDNTNVNHDLAVVADGGTVITSGGILASSIAWAPDGTFPNVYVGTRSASSFVVDHANLTVDGNGTHLTSRASVALVDANPGSFFISGASVYVRTVDSRAPDANVEIIMGVNGPTMNGANNYYVEGLDFRGGNSAFYCTNATRGVFVNSKFRYSLTSNGLDTDGTANVYVYGCEASENCADGFNYHTTTYVVEQGCVGYGNGWGLAGSNNGSSQHENNAIIRVGCTYRRNNGPQIADITTADSWNVGVEASHPFGVAGWQSTGIYSEGNQWLHDCYCHDCDYDIYEAGAETTYTFNTRYTTHFGTLVAYAGAGTGAALVPSAARRRCSR